MSELDHPVLQELTWHSILLASRDHRNAISNQAYNNLILFIYIID